MGSAGGAVPPWPRCFATGGVSLLDGLDHSSEEMDLPDIELLWVTNHTLTAVPARLSAAARVECPTPPDQSRYWPRPCSLTPPCPSVASGIINDYSCTAVLSDTAAGSRRPGMDC